uniref:Thymosin beta-a-like n=1 Tax=Gouania willdenowi TaxID=441366 RepID=A0A8C5DP99_GOUWI
VFLPKKSSTMSDALPVTEELTQFNKGKLKKTNTKEKNILPTKDDIAQEKKEKGQGSS